MKKFAFIQKLFLSFTLVACLAAPIVASAGILRSTKIGDDQNAALREGAGFTASTGTNYNLIYIINLGISVFLGVLGIIFVILLLLAGYNYMMAQGDSGKVSESLNTIKRAIIGLIIIVSAYAITYFVFTNLPGGNSPTSTGEGSGTPTGPAQTGTLP